MKKLLKNQKGFTLVELLAVIVILGIIAAIAIPSIGAIIDNSKKDAHIANAEMLVSAARLAIASNDTALLDGTGDDANKITMDELAKNGYLESKIEDPDASGTYYTDDSYVRYYPSPVGGKTDKYTVYLKGSKRYVGVATGAIPISDLDRKAVINIHK